MSGAATRTHGNHALAVPDISRRARISVVRMRGDSSSTSTSPPSASGADPGELDRDRREVDAESEHSLSGELVQMPPRAIADVEHRAVQRVKDARVDRIGRTDGALDGQRQHGSVGEPGLHSRPRQPGSERAVGLQGQRRRHATAATPEAKRDHGASRDLDRVHVAQRRLLVHPETEPVESGALLAERRRETHRTR